MCCDVMSDERSTDDDDDDHNALGRRRVEQLATKDCSASGGGVTHAEEPAALVCHLVATCSRSVSF